MSRRPEMEASAATSFERAHAGSSHFAYLPGHHREPCIRQTLQPRTAGALHCFPVRFDLAMHAVRESTFSI